MTYYCVSNIESGNLIDVDYSIPTKILPEHILSISEGEIPDRFMNVWNNSDRCFVPRPNISRDISVLKFLNRFTAIERIRIKEYAKTDPALSDYFEMMLAAQSIDLDDQTTIGGLYYLIYLGLLEIDRVQEILN